MFKNVGAKNFSPPFFALIFTLIFRPYLSLLIV